MTAPTDIGVIIKVAALYAALVVGLIIVVASKNHKNLGVVLLTATAAVINFRYGLTPVGDNVSFFISVFDLPMNLGIQSAEHAKAFPGLTTCAGNNCSQSSFLYHSSWAADFYDRFEFGDTVRRAKLYTHVWANTLALILSFFQFQATLRRSKPRLHTFMGRAAALLTLIGTSHALMLGTEHGDIETYGKEVTVAGWFVMGVTVLGTLIPGVVAARKRDFASHRVWMTRYYGAMWGSYLIFRLVFLVGGPLLRSYKSLNAILAVWVSAPAGVIIAEIWLRQQSTAAVPSAVSSKQQQQRQGTAETGRRRSVRIAKLASKI